jgi:V-type H+-transporting ATPase subunit a
MWTLLVRREKAVYHTMNMFNFDSNRKCLIAEGWVASNSISEVSYALRAASERTGTMVSSVINELSTKLDPPTFHRTSPFTEGFQEIVDSYGMATYQEVNPGIFTIISFPFLFAVMFGDFGHGIMMSLAGAYLVINAEKMSKNKTEVCLNRGGDGGYLRVDNVIS